MQTLSPHAPTVAVVGGGPAGLMAAEIIAQGGARVELYDAMPSVGRKFLLAGVGGMNITHAEAPERFLSRYYERSPHLEPLLQAFGAEALRAFIHELGIPTFVGSSGRVFPRDMKAAPLLRAWLQRLRAAGVAIHTRTRWLGWTSSGELLLENPQGQYPQKVDALQLALGGGSWAKLGSDGAWLPRLAERGVDIAPLQAANCGFECTWSAHLRERFAGAPLKPVVARLISVAGEVIERQGECIVTEQGVEGSLIYALSKPLRELITAQGHATLTLDLAPGRDLPRVIDELSAPRGAKSLSSHLQSRVGITGVKAALLRECLTPDVFQDSEKLARGIKALPVTLNATRPMDEAISCAGGVRFEALNEQLMLNALPGVFCAGEMLDWEAPTGGYLLTACFATGRAAGLGVLNWLKQNH